MVDKPEIEVNDELELVGDPKKCHLFRWIDKDMLSVKLSYAIYFASVGTLTLCFS